MSRKETDLNRSGPVAAVTMEAAAFDAWQALVAPGDVFRHPREVLHHPALSSGEKRTILAAWASDACALENAPGLRCLTGCRAEPVSVDAVLTALAELDRDGPRRTKAAARPRPAARRPRGLAHLHRYVRLGRRDDDDDPPPCPAAAAPPPRISPSGTLAVIPA